VKLTCKQQDLARGLSTVSHAVSTRSTLPILSNILLAAENGRLRLSATNLEIGITCWVPANIQEEGSTTSPSRLLTDFVNTLPPTEVTLALQASGQSLKVSDQRSQATIRGMEPGEFPAIPTADGGQPPLTVSAGELKAMIAEWWRQAEVHKVLPLDDRFGPRFAENAARTHHRRQFVFHAGVGHIPTEVAPDIRRRATYAQVGKEKRFVLRKDVVPLDP